MLMQQPRPPPCANSTGSLRVCSPVFMLVPKIPKRTREIYVGRTSFRRIIEGLERIENPKVGASPWWLLVALLLALGAAGTFFGFAGAVLSPMAFDAPDAAAKTWPWVLLFSALGLAAICPVALAAGSVLAWRRRLVTACGILSLPALVAVLFWLWLRQ
jgi:hypothetical protein